MRESDRFARYLAGELSAAEAAALERDAAADSALGARLRAARAAWAGASADERGRVDVDAAWRRFAARAAERDRATQREHTRDVLPLHPRAAAAPPVSRRARMITPWRAAATVLLVLGAAVIARTWLGRDTITTATGEVRAVTLADGSEVRLGPDSRLVVQRGYGDRHRNVELRGEALFRAAPLEGPPLVVLTETARVRDVATAFIVRALDRADDVRVVVTDGTVWFGRLDAPTGEGVLLHAGQQAVLADTDTMPRPLGATDTVAALAWTQGRLRFDHTPLRDVAAQLERWYDLNVVIIDPVLANRRLSATFEHESATEVIDIIARSLTISYRRDGRNVVFTPAR